MTAVEEPSVDVPFTPPVVRAEPDTRLDQLIAEYHALKPLADEYAARLDTIKTGIKAELIERHPDQREIVAVGSTVPTPLRLQAVQKWSLDSKKLKSEKPEIWVRYAQQTTSWPLTQFKQS